MAKTISRFLGGLGNQLFIYGAPRAIISLPYGRVSIVANIQGDTQAYADFWLMTLCQHFIIANSTFSWWEALLSGSTEKIVIAPGFEQQTGNA